MDQPLTLYYLELKNKNIFLYASPTTDETKLFSECVVLFDYVRKYPPVRILNKTDIYDSFEVDCYVKKNIKLFGINNIRGGSYSMEIIPDYMLKTLEYELLNINKLKLDMLDAIEKNIKSNGIDIESEKLKKLACDYNDILSKRDILKLYNGQTIDRTLLTDLEWLSEYYNKTDEDLTIYNCILLRLRAAYEIFKKHIDRPIKHSIYLSAPEFIFDTVFYRPHEIKDWSKTNQDIQELIGKYEYISYAIINKIEEYDFDLSTFPENFEIYNEVFNNYVALNAATE
jgi:hypothetical protein